MTSFDLHTGSLPLLISMPHVGTEIPSALHAAFRDEALRVPDTDWFVDRLYAAAGVRGASLLRARYSRYVIDLNRAPDSAPLYPGASNTELCPTTGFDDAPLYRDGAAPDAAEIDRRRRAYWQPYHDALANELARLRAQHGYAILFDAHSIRSQVPRFFSGRLPDINYGTADGASCARAMQDSVWAVDTQPYTKIINGRFKGGYITRHYGNPEQGIHALQLELSQITYMDEDRFLWDDARAAGVIPVLMRVIDSLLALTARDLQR